MLRLLVRRARAQWPLLISVLAVLVVGATLLGTCALLITQTSERALEVAAARAAPDDTAVTAYAVTMSAADARSVADDTRRVLTSTIAPFTATTSTRASSVVRFLPSVGADRTGVPAAGYLSGIDGLQSRAKLVSGRWPRATATTGAPLEAAVLQSTARLLGLTVGSRVTLGRELTRDTSPTVAVTVVGVIRPLPAAGWNRDPLNAAGYAFDPPDSTSARPVHAYGPFIVGVNDLLASGSAIARLDVTANPDLSHPTARGLDVLSAALVDTDRRLAGTLGDRVDFERISSALPQTLFDERRQQELTTAAVLALALMGIVLTAIALAVAGRLTSGVRDDESELLTALGTSRGQFTAQAATEAGLLALLAAALSVPASSALHVALTHLPPLAPADLGAPFTVTGPQLLAVGTGALALAVLLIVLAARPISPAGQRRRRREQLARSGADVLLVALAGVGCWQLIAQPTTPGYGIDAIRVLAPTLLLAAGSAVALRVMPPLLRRAERLAERGRGFALSMAALGAARRPQAVAAGLLIALGCAAATFGTAFGSTWHLSQRDQADLSVGTDLTVTLDAPPAAGQSALVSSATGGVISPVADHGVAVGQWLGGAGSPPRMVAVDTRNASELMRGRLDSGRGWGDVGRVLAPPPPVIGLGLPGTGTATLRGTATGSGVIAVNPQLMLQDEAGLRTSCAGTAIELDGRPHPLPSCAAGAGQRLVGVALPVIGDSGVQRFSNLDVTLTLPGAAGTDPASPWQIKAASAQAQQLTGLSVAVTGRQLRFAATVSFSDAAPSSRVVVATAFADPGAVPVAISQRFAEETGAHVGTRLTVTVEQSSVPVVVAATIPVVPSAPGDAAALADLDTLSRALAVRGNLDSPVTGWWVGHPERAGAAERAQELHIGTVVTRASETDRLTSSPLRASLPALLRVIVIAAVLLVLGGVILHVTCDLQLRALEVARLRGLGVSRRGIRAALLAEHAAVLLPQLVAGAIVGALAARLLAPPMIRSDTGAAPVPAVDPQWPWGAETVILVLLIAGSALAVAAVVSRQARRADAAHLRVAS